ncbi:NmrA family transcriptional regulator [Paracoccus sp. S1E-3]|uniref:NmrA family NAD(P)-binding protein n=1 Tax=Paracoccus sp. S1E-3 TaxID=2756130 RepID=UPI0015EFCBF2|nr:NmrA family transcriptional regulator [Paracoccus sp. S1E-3]MBA4491107.1 NmrA family transcriptional regulator [Paracoccus sp. S1E-3]
MDGTTLIIGAGGKTGTRVAARLAKQGPLRPVSRRTSPPFDWKDRRSWAPALQGATRAYVTFQPDLAIAGADADIAELARLGREAGLEQMVLLSGRGEPGAQRAEQALIESGLDWNVVRASWFAQNFSEGVFVDGIRAGLLALPAGPVPEPFIDADDIADVATAALTDPSLRNRIFEVTGPRALTFAEAVDIIAAATGRPVAYRQISPADFADGLTPYLPPDVIALLVSLFTEVLDGRNIATADGVQQALGHAPRDFADYAALVAATGVWETVP